MMAELTVTLTPAIAAQQKMIIRVIRMLVAQQHFMVNFCRWQELDQYPQVDVATLLRLVMEFTQEIDELHPGGTETLVDDLVCLAKVIGIDMVILRESRRHPLMAEPITTACPICAQQPNEPCIWAKPMPHPLYHSERGDMAASNRNISTSSSGDIPEAQFDLAVERLGIV